MMSEKVDSATKETSNPIHSSIAQLSCLLKRRKLFPRVVVPEEFSEIHSLFNVELFKDPFGYAKFVDSVRKIVGLGSFSKRAIDE